MSDILRFEPNTPRDPQFAEALLQVSKNGVQIRAVECVVTANTIEITKDVQTILD